MVSAIDMKQLTRIIAVLLLLVFGFGAPGYASPTGKMETHKLSMMTDMKSGVPDDCGKSAGDMAMSVCVSMCSVVPSDASEASVSIELGRAVFHGAFVRTVSGLIVAPDPFPPKQFI